MVKFTANSDPSTGTGGIVLNTFDDLNAKDANISNIQTVSLDVAEGLNVDGTLTAASTEVDLANIGNIKVSDNIITLIDGSIFSEIIIKAPTVTIDSFEQQASYAKIKSDDLEVTDTVINIGKGNISSVQDRGIIFDYISGSNTLQGFFGFNPHDSYFRMLTNITDYTNNIAYNRTDNTKYDLGNLELTKLIVTNIENNNESNDLNITAQDNMNLTATTQNINIIATDGDVNIKSSNNNKSVYIGNGLDSKTIFNSNVLVQGTLNADQFAFFNSNESIYATKNILLYLDNTVKVDAIAESSSGTYTIEFNEDRAGYSAGNYIYFEGTSGLSAFNGIHIVQSVDSSSPTSVITINYTAGITIPAFDNSVYAILGVVTQESLSSNSGISVVTYEDNDKTLREHKFHYEFDSNSNLDSSWKINRNLKTDNTLLLKPQDIYYENHQGFTRLQVKDDGELYFVNSNGHEYKLSNRIEEDIGNFTPWALTRKESIYTYNKVIINDSKINDNFELRVKGNVDITGDINSGGDVVFNNADLTGSFSVNGFKSANINTHTLTVKDNNFQIGFYNVLEIDKLYSSADALSLTHYNDYTTAIDKHLFVRVEVKLQDGQIAFFQDCNIYYSSDATNYTSINGMRAIKKIGKKIIQIYTDKTTNTIVDGSTIKLYRSSVNPPKYIGINNRPNTIIDNIPFGTDASVYPSDLKPIRIRIFIDSFDGTNYTFKYSITSGFSYVNTNIAISSTLSTIYYLTATSGLSTADITNSASHTDLGIKIRFTDISQLSVNDYWEFDCAPTYISSLDDFGALVKPKSINFLGEFGYMLENTNIQDSGFEIMFHDDNNVKTSEKFSFFYNNDNDAYWKLTNNIHVMGTIQMETKTDPTSNIINQGQMIYRDDKKLHFINEDNYSSVLDNDLASQFDISMWNITNDDKVHTYSSVVIGDSDINDKYKLRVKGNVQITGRVDASAGDLTANNADLSGSLSVNGFKSTNLNTQNLTVEDRNYQVGFIDVILIDNLDETNKLIKSRIPHKLNTGDYVYFQETSIYFNDSGDLRSINGFRKIEYSSASALKVYDFDNNTYNTSVVYKTFNPPRYIGLNNVSDSVIDNTITSFTGEEAVRLRIMMTSSTQFKYSLNAGFSYEATVSTIDTTTTFNLTEGGTSLGISIKFTSVTGLTKGDYWEFDCCPPYVVKKDANGEIIPPSEENFLGEFGKMFPKNELLDAGFEVMMRNPDTFTLESQKFSYFYTNENDAFWKLTANLHTKGSIQMETKIEPPSSVINQGQLVYRDDKKLHFINEDRYTSVLDNDMASQFDISLWNISNDDKVHTYSSVVIADSDISDKYKLRVKGNVQITGRVDASAGDLTANNADLSGSLSVNGFKSTNLNTQNLTVEDRNYQVGFIDVILIDNLDETNKLIKSRIPHKLNTGDYVYFQETSIYFNDSGVLRSINGFRKIENSSSSALKVFDTENNTYNTSVVYKTFNPPRYIGLNNVADTVIDNTITSFTGEDAVRLRIMMTSSSQFKYSLNAGYSYEATVSTIDTTTTFNLTESGTSLGISIKFTSVTGLTKGDYWEFDCCPPYVVKKDANGEIIPPSEENFLGEFGKMFPKNELLDAGFEVMMRNPDTFTLESQKFSYFYTNENDAFWKLTANLHTKGSIQMETKIDPPSSVFNQGQLVYRDDKKLHFVNEDRFTSVLDNDMASQFDISLWNITNDDKVHTYSSVVIADSDISDNYKLRVKGNVQITGKVDAAAGDLTANNADLSGSLSVNGFKSTNLNTQNLTVEDRNYQIGYIDVILIDNLDETNKLIKSRIPHKLNTGDYVYFQETSIYFNDSGTLRSINGFRKIEKSSASALKVYDFDNNTYDTSVVYKTFNPPRYIGLNNVLDSVIDNTTSSFTGEDAVRLRIMMISSTQFKYSLNAGFSYESTISTINTTTTFNLTENGTSLGISIKFTSVTGLNKGDYWEFDCCPPYVVKKDANGEIIPPSEENFLGEFGKMFPKNELLDAGFEVMMRNPDTFTLESQKFSYFYTNENDAFWKLTANLHTKGSIQMETKIDPPSSVTNQGQLVYRDDKKLHFINEDRFTSVLDNDMASQFDVSLWNITNDDKVHTYSSVVIADSDISDNYKLRVKGNVQITGRVDASAGDLTANNADLSGSLSVNGFKSTNLNTQNLTVEDRNYQVGFIDVILIDNLDENNKLIKSRIPHKLNTDDYVYFQETSIYFNDSGTLRPINGFRKIEKSSASALKVFDTENNTYNTPVVYKTFNPPRYIGLNNVADTVIDNTTSSFTGEEAVRLRIFMTSSTQFKYSLNAGYSYESTISTIDTTTTFNLTESGTSLGISIKFTSITGLSKGDYWEFDCCPPYVVKKDANGEIIPPSEENFLGEFGKMFPKNELLDAGFEVMMRNPDTFTLESQKFSYFYTNENDAFWKLTANLHTKGSIQMETKIDPPSSVTNQGQLVYRDDKKLHFINEDRYTSILDNDLASQFDISVWNITNDDKVHTYSSVVIADSDISDNYKLRVKGNVQITGRVDASAGDLTANNADLSGSLSVNGFKSTNLNTQNLTVEDRNYQVGFIDVILIDNLDETNKLVKSRIPHKLNTGDYVYFQETSVYFNNSGVLRSINGFRKIEKSSASALKVYDFDNNTYDTSVVYKTFNPPRYIGLNNVLDSVIDNTITSFTGEDAVRLRIMMTSSNQFKYSLNAGYSYETTVSTIDTTTTFNLTESGTSLGISIKFTSITGLSKGDYWEFDCCPPYVVKKDANGEIIPPSEENFLGEFGKMFPKNELLDAGFEVMMRNPDTFTLESQKFSYFYTNENDAFWKLTANLHTKGSIQLEVKDEPASNIANYGQLVYRDDKKLHFINEDNFDIVLNNEVALDFGIDKWSISNNLDSVYSFNKIGINLSNPDKQFEVNGEARIRNTLQVDSDLKLGTDGAFLRVDNDNHIYFFDKNGFRNEITNDLVDIESINQLSNWSIDNNDTAFTYNKIGINISNPDKQFEVNGEARIRDNLQVDSDLKLGTNGAFLRVDDDNHIYFFDKNGFRHEITNDLMDTDNDGLIPITNWNLSNDQNTVYSYNKIGINLSNPNKQFEVNGEARIRDNLQVDSDLKLGTDGAFLRVDNDNNIYFFDKNGFRNEITNDLVDIDFTNQLSNWSIDNNDTAFTYNKIGINLSNPDKQFEVNGEARIRDNLQVDSNLLLGKDGAYFKVDTDGQIYFFDKDGIKHEITNDLVDSEAISQLSSWNIDNNTTTYSFNKIGINLSNPDKQFEVNGEARIRDNLQVDSDLKLGTDGAFLRVDDDNHIYFFDKNGFRHEITNDLMDTDNDGLIPISNWNLSNDQNTVYSYNKIGVNLSNPDKQFEVNGEARIRNNLQVDSDLKLGTDGAFLRVDNDNHIYFFDKNGFRNEITNDLVDIESINQLSNWSIDNNDTAFTYNKIGINLSNPDKQFEVNGEARIRDNLQVDSNLLLGEDGAYFNVDSDGMVYFFDKDGIKHEITNDLVDSEVISQLSSWNIDNNTTTYSFNKIGINLSNPDKQFEVNGEARIRNSLQVDSDLKLGTEGAFLKVDDDNHIYFFDKNGFRHEITNDLMDTDNDGLIPITNWNLSNDQNTVYSHNKIGINLSNPDKQLEVNGEARIRDNLQVDSDLKLGTDGAFLRVDNDNHIYFFDKNGFRNEITNDLVDIDFTNQLSNWSIDNNETAYTFNKVGINLSNPDKQFEVNGEARIRNNLQVDSNLLLGKDGAYFKVDSDGQIYFFDKDGIKHEITNDLVDSEVISQLSSWNIDNNTTTYSFNKIGINLSNPDKQFEVNGEARIRDNLQVDSNLKLGTDGAFLKVDDDNHIYFFDKNGFRHEITNDLMDTDNDGLIPINNWNLSNDQNTVYSYNKIGVNLSNPDKQFEVNGEARIRNNLQVDSDLKLGKDGAFLRVDDDNHIYFIDKNGFRHEITNDLMDTDDDGIIPISNWYLSNDQSSVYSYNKIGINLSNPDKQLDVNGEVRIRDVLQVDNNIKINKDSGVLGFGADNEITLTHVHDTGLILNSGKQLQFGNAGEYISGDGTDLSVVSSGKLLLDSTNQLDINSSSGIINIGNDNVNQNINIGTGGTRTITIGSNSSTVQLVGASFAGDTSLGGTSIIVPDMTVVGSSLDSSATSKFNGNDASSGSVDHLFNSSETLTFSSRNIMILDARGLKTSDGTVLGTGTMNLKSGSGGFNLDSSGAIAINSTGGAISIGNDDNDQNINIGTDGERTIAIGTSSGTGSTPSTAINLNAVTVAIDATTGGISLDAGATSNFTTSDGSLTLEGKTGVNINENGSTIIAISDNRGISTTNTSTIDLDCSSTLNLNSTGGVISIGNDDNDQNINIGTDGERTIAIGTSSGTGSAPSTAINLNAVTVTIDATTGGISLDAGATSNFTTSDGSLTLEGKTGVNINENGDTIIGISDTRGISTTNTSTIDLDCSSTLNLNSTGGAISIGNEDNDQNINIGTDGERSITIGNTTADTEIIINSGSNGKVTIGTIKSGTWEGTAIAPTYGGIGADISSIAKGGLLSGTGSGTFGIKTVGTNGNVLIADSTAAGGISWLQTLPVANGGTGTTSLTDKAVLISQDTGTDAINSVEMSTNGQLLIGGTSGPAAATLSAGNGISISNGDGSISVAVSGLAVAQGGTGLSAISKGSVLIANSADTLSALDGGGSNDGILFYTSSSDTISWNTSLASSLLSGEVAVGNGGTGLSAISKGSVLIANSANTLSALDGGGSNDGILFYSSSTDTISWSSNNFISISDSESTPNTSNISLGGSITFASSGLATVLENNGTVTIGCSASLNDLSDVTVASNKITFGDGNTTAILPTDDNEVDLGANDKQFKDLHINGTAYLDAIGFGTTSLTLPTSDGSANQVLSTDGSGTLSWVDMSSGGANSLNDLSDVTVASNKITFGDGNTTAILPTNDNEVDLGASDKQFKDLYINGTAYLDAIGFGSTSLTLPTADGSADQVLSTDGSGTLSWVTLQSSLTFGISDTNAVKIDGTPSDDNYARFTANGIEGRSITEVKTDLSLDNVENTTLSTWPGSSNITTLGEINYKRKTLSTQADGTTLSVSDSGATILQSTDDATLTLPTSTAGVTYTFIWIGIATEGFTISPDSSDKIVGSIIDTGGSIVNATNSGAGAIDKDIILGENSTVGNRLTLMADGNNNWIITEGLGNWSFEE